MFSRQQKARRHIDVNRNHIPFPFHRMYAEQFSCLSALHSGMKSAISSVHSLTDSAGILWAPARKVLVNQRDTALGLATPLDGSQSSLWCPLMAATGFYKFITSHTFAWFLQKKNLCPLILVLLANVEPPSRLVPLPLSYSTHPSRSLQVVRTTLAFNYHHYHPQSWEAFVRVSWPSEEEEFSGELRRPEALCRYEFLLCRLHGEVPWKSLISSRPVCSRWSIRGKAVTGSRVALKDIGSHVFLQWQLLGPSGPSLWFTFHTQPLSTKQFVK